MSKHYYFTNSLPKLLAGTAAPLGLGGLVWLSTLAGVGSGKSKSGAAGGLEAKWMRATGRNVGEVVWTSGPGVVALVGGMSVIGHKVSNEIMRWESD
jgi:alpha-1,6-mannosyltransferase